MKITFISEDVFGKTDEGMKNFALQLFRVLGEEHKTDGAAIYRTERRDPPEGFVSIGSNRLFLSRSLRSFLHETAPDLIIYASASCGNTAAMLRMKILKLYAPKAKIAVIAYQPVRYGFFEKMAAPLLLPDFIFSLSPVNGINGLARNRFHFLPGGVDTAKFLPVDRSEKLKLREKFGFAKTEFIGLHVGHINPNRGIGNLAALASLPGVRIVVAGSTSTPVDERLAAYLRSRGVTIFQEFIGDIEKLYQLADVYLFPVVNLNASVAMPLSVLEAMACNLPVLTTPFGALPHVFEEDGSFTFFTGSNLTRRFNAMRSSGDCANRDRACAFDWARVGERLVNAVAASNTACN